MRLTSISQSIGSIGRRAAVVAAAATIACVTSGCLDKGLFDQTELGAFNKGALVVPVVKNLGTGVEEPVDQFVNSTEPTADDQVVRIEDYGLTAGDLIFVSITDLVGPGVETTKQVRVSETGKISLPYINQISIAGLTEAQAEEAISRAYRDAQIIQNATVSVIATEPRGRTFSIAGAVGRPGQYPIYKSDFRLLDAFVVSADFEITRGTRGYENVYIFRKKDDAAAPAPTTPSNEPPADILRPRGELTPPSPFEAEPAVANDLRRATYLRAQPADAPVEQPTTQPTNTGEGRYVIIDGKPVLVGGQPATAAAAPGEPGATPTDTTTPGAMPPAVTETPTAQPADAGMATTPPPGAFEFNAPQEPADLRVIRVPIDKLVRGELKYNIVIRPGDTIFVPSPIEGVYYMGGHVARVGVYALQGNKVSLMDAIIAAGGLDQVAVPWRTQVIRRIEGDKQIFATVDVTKIFNGEEPDIFLKRDDKVIVGTQFWAPFLAAFRNGFRFTYGFGFLYDRNYYDDDNINN